ncbi:MAG: tetratricopeptide repeat protein, partial [Candidatus Cryptobacteroides sp.]
DYLQAVFRQADRQFINTFKPQFDTTVSIAGRVHPNDTSILETAGLYYFSTGRREKAADAFRTMKELNPDNPVPAAEYIRILLFCGEWEQAVEESEAAFKKFDHEPGFLDFANTAEYQLKNYDKIVENCTRMLVMSPGDSAVFVSSWSTIGDMKHKLGDDKNAFKAYDILLKRYPDYAPALNNYAWFLAEDGKKLKKALAMSKKTVDAEPDNVTYLDTYGWILYLLGRPAEAKPYFKHAMMYGGKESATILRHYAVVLEALGESDLAAVYRKQAEAKAGEEEE